MKVLVVGSKGKMGNLVFSLLKNDLKVEHVYGFDRYENETNDLFNQFDNIPNVDILIDFSNPSLLDQLLNYSLKNKVSLVIATTGYTEDEMLKIKQASKLIPVFYSANYSIGIEIITQMLKEVSKSLEEGYDIEIIEQHHKHKVDSPSGTAIHLANSINETLKVKKTIINGHHELRSKDQLAIHSIRGGSVVGEHQVLFMGQDEVIEIKHSAQSRNIFAYGAIKAAKYLMNKENGFYQMKDLIKE